MLAERRDKAGATVTSSQCWSCHRDHRSAVALLAVSDGCARLANRRSPLA